MKKRVEIVKVAAPRGKGSLKRPSDTEVASARPVKQSKKVVPNLSMSAIVMRIAVGAPGSKGGGSAKKGVALAQKCRIPAMRILAEASSVESHDSSPHGQTPRGSLPEITSRPEPRDQTPQGSVPETVPRTEPKASLQITHMAGTGGASILDVVATIAVG
jgi:hypothetical protein